MADVFGSALAGRSKERPELVDTPLPVRATFSALPCRGHLGSTGDLLRYDRLPPVQKERLRLLHGSLIYRDQRRAGFDAAAVVEVIEHLDAPRLAAFERVLFECARPKTVVITTPNHEYNVKWETLIDRHRLNLPIEEAGTIPTANGNTVGIGGIPCKALPRKERFPPVNVGRERITAANERFG